MRIWIDISNAPHVNFFKKFIKEWGDKGHDIIVTTRPLSNTIDLLEENNVQYKSVGSHYGKSSFQKVSGFFKRCQELYDILKDKKVDLAISQSSFYSPYVAKRLKIPSIYTNDNEFAKGNLVGFLLARKILLPEALKEWAAKKYFRRRVVFYPGIKEGIYIEPIFSKSHDAMRSIYFRPEPWHAQYHSYATDTFDKFLKKLAKSYKIYILPRDENQFNHFLKLSEMSNNIDVVKKVEKVNEIALKCNVFLGAGGSMTREFSILGIPTISLYQGNLLEVDKFLIDRGILMNIDNPELIDESFIENYIYTQKQRTFNIETIQNEGINAREIIHNLVETIK